MGAIAGFTVFLGLPVAILRNVSVRAKGFLNAVSIGILVFLISDVLANAWTIVKDAASSAYAGQSSETIALLDLTVMLAGLGIGLFMLTAYERRYAKALIVASAKPRRFAVFRKKVGIIRNLTGTRNSRKDSQ